MSTLSPLRSGGTCNLEVDTTLPLVCIGSLLSFLCGVGIGANDLSANFAMVVGSGSLNMKQAIVYCTVFELLGAAFMGGRVGNTIRNGIVQASLFNENRDLVIIGMTCATFAAAVWLYLSTVFGLPVSITHTVIGSIIGFAVFSTWSFSAIRLRGVVVIVLSWVLAPVAACAVTAACFYWMRRRVLLVRGRSFELALHVLPYCLALSLLVDYMFILIERPPILTVTLAAYLPVWALYVLILLAIVAFCWASARWVFPAVADVAIETSSFVWESPALRTEPIDAPAEAVKEGATGADSISGKRQTHMGGGGGADALDSTLSLFKSHTGASRVGSDVAAANAAAQQAAPPAGASDLIDTSFGSLLFSKTARSDAAGAGAGEDPALTDAVNASGATYLDGAQRGRSPGPRVSGRGSTVLTSITTSDSHFMRSTSVHLAPVGRRSPLPSRAPTPACNTTNTTRSTTPAILPQGLAVTETPAESYRHFDPSQLPAAQLPPATMAAGVGHHPNAASPLLAGGTGGVHEDAVALGAVPSLPHYGATAGGSAEGQESLYSATFVAPSRRRTPHGKAAMDDNTLAADHGGAVGDEDEDDAESASVCSEDEFGEEDWRMDHPMQPIRFGGLLIKPFNPRAEYLFTGLQVVAGSMSSFVHGAVAGANATATFVILYEVFSNHELGETDLSARWSVLPAMLGIAIGMFSLGAALMKTVGMELVTVTPARGWCIQVGGTLVTMVLTGLGIPVSLSQSQVGAAIGCGMLDAKMKGVSWGLVGKIVGGWFVTLVISAVTTGLSMLVVAYFLCG